MLLVGLPTCLLCVAAFFCEVVFQGLLVVCLVGAAALGLLDFLCAACFQVLLLVCLLGQLFFVNCLLASRASNLFVVCRCAFCFCSLLLFRACH